jgi:hypothetical protein
MTNEFIFQSKQCVELFKMMTPNDNETFLCDIRAVKWYDYYTSVCYGIRRFFLLEDCLHPTEEWKQLLIKR